MAARNLVDTSNWGYAPHNRWGFQNVQELFPTARLVSSHNRPELPSDSRDFSDLAYTDAGGQQRTVQNMLAESFTDAFLVVHADTVATELYFNDMTADSLHLLNSISKSFVGMLAGIAVDQGLLNPSESVTHYLSDMNAPAWSGTTIRHLLDMTAAVAFTEDYADPQVDFWCETAVVGWRPALVNDQTPSTLRQFAASLSTMDQDNGEKFHYKTVLTNVLGMVLQEVMGERLQDLLETHLWARLGTRNDAAIVVDSNGFPYVGAGMNVSARDLANFGRMINGLGRLDGQQIVPATWVEDTIHGDDTSVGSFALSEYAEVMPGWHYRNQVWVKDSAHSVCLGIGIHGQILYMDREKDVVIVKLSSQPESVDMPMYLDAFSAMESIAASFS